MGALSATWPRIIAGLYEGTPVSHESVHIADWGDCQVAAYTSTDGAMIINASNPKAYGELDWHLRDHLVLLREIPDTRKPRCVVYFCRIKDLFDAPPEHWIGKAGVKWTYVGAVARRKDIFPNDALSEHLV